MLPNFKLYYKALVIKQYGIVIKSHTDQWNRIEGTEINSCVYGQLIFDKGAKNTQCGMDILFNKWCWGNWISTCKK